MGVRLLLDAHLSPRVARALRERGIDAASLREWKDRTYLNSPDEDIMRAAETESRTLVTFDVHSIPRLTQEFAESGFEYGGVVLISEKTFKQDDIGGLMRALEQFAAQYADVDLRNQVLYLSK